MLMEQQERDNRVARRLLGYYIDNEYKEIIQIEYRYAGEGEFDLYTRIQGYEYQISEYKFFSGLAELLDQLPATSKIVISHRIIVLEDDIEKMATLEEVLSQYDGNKPTDTVVYQLKLLIGNECIETPRSTTSGYQMIDFGTVAEDLRKRLGERIQLKICYFCKYLVEYNDFGGTDYRHDQLYCFRDSPETLKGVMKIYPVLRGQESLLTRGTPDMDAMHCCAAFTYRVEPRP